MDWAEANRYIQKSILSDVKLDPSTRYGRIVVLTPPSKPRSGMFRGMEAYYIQIGKNKFVWIPVAMLEKLFNAALANKGDFNRVVFDSIYPNVAGPNGTPCYIHVVGKIFELSGLTIRRKYGTYWIKSFL